MKQHPKYPEVIKTANGYCVVGIPEFKGGNKGVFKTEDALRRCYAWWYNNAYIKNTKAKIAKLDWKNGGKEKFYEHKAS